MKKNSGAKNRQGPLLRVSVLFCIVLSLCLACAGQKNMPEAEKTRQEVVLWSYYETQKQKEGLDKLVEGFNQSQEAYEARWEYQGPSSEFKKQLSIGVAEENLPDLVLIDNPDMRSYVELGIFEDISDAVNRQYDVSAFYSEVISSVC